MLLRLLRNVPAWIGLLAVILNSVAEWQQVASAKDIFEGPNVFPSQILVARGFLAEDHQLISDDKHVLKLTRGLNPLINGGRAGRSDKIPILFIHGILESFNVFVTNSFNVKPKDFSNISLASLSLDEAKERYAKEPSAKSLALLALNHGHEVWLMSRRGFPGSRTMLGDPKTGNIGEVPRTRGPIGALLGTLTDLVDLTQYSFSFDKHFWNYSLDEQAKFDLPRVVNYVLEKTGHKQLSVVGHSAGGAVTLMALSLYPELNTKINHAILWSEAFSLGRGDIFRLLLPYKPLLKHFVGATPPTFLTESFLGLAGVVCSLPFMKRQLCEDVADLILGKSRGQAPIRPEFINSLLYSTSSHEIDQLLQNAARRGPMHKFNFGRRKNRIVYGQPEPPAYNLSRVTLERISFYEAATDFMVSVEDIRATEQLLRVPYRRHLIRSPFNHQGYFFHDEAARLVIIPSLREIQEFSETGAI